MNDSRVNTIRVPRIPGTPTVDGAPGTAPPAQPTCIVSNAQRNCTVRIRNNAFAAYVLVAYDAANLTTFPTVVGTWQIPAGMADEFIVAKGQSLHVSTPSGGVDGEGVEVSYHVFQAFPVDEEALKA